MLPEPLLKVDVSTPSERGMLGIAIGKSQTDREAPRYVFLYYTKPEPENKANDTLIGTKLNILSKQQCLQI